MNEHDLDQRAFEHESLHRDRKLIPKLLLMMGLVFTLMAGQEWVKGLLFPHITMWRSQLITILFATAIATLGAFWGFRKVEMGQRRLLEEILAGKPTEAALRATCKKSDDIIEWLPEPTFVVDHEGKVIGWNRAMESLTGVKKQDILGQGNEAYSKPFYDEPRPMLIDLVLSGDQDLEARSEDLAKVGDHFQTEFFSPRVYGGKGAHLRAVASLLRDENGATIGAIEAVRDITIRKEPKRRSKSSSFSCRLSSTPCQTRSFTRMQRAYTGDATRPLGPSSALRERS
jgi:PAS domain S-box-containing protein